MVGVLAFWPPDRSTSLEGGGRLLGACERGYVLMWANIFSSRLFFHLFSPCQPRIANEKSCWQLGLASSEIGSVNDIG